MSQVYRLEDARHLTTEERRRLLGGKGASLVTMAELGLPVPPAFVVTTEACRHYLESGRLPAGLLEEVAAALDDLEATLGRRLDDSTAPLLLSVRSGAPVSMPGMMDTVLNLGLTPSTIEGLATVTGDPAFARDAGRRFLESFGSVVLGIPGEAFSVAVGRAREREVSYPTTADPVLEAYRGLVAEQAGPRVPDRGWTQLVLAIEAVFRSWELPRARTYRELEGIDDALGTAVTVQAMVFGNLDDRSGTGVAFTRDPNTGEPGLYGDFLLRAQGEDVVSGRHATLPLSDLGHRLPDAERELAEIGARLERELGDMCDLEFTVESGRLWLLQARPGKRAALAAVRIAVDLVEEGIIDPFEALRRVTPEEVRRLGRPRLDPATARDRITVGLGASPGLATGRICFSADDALAAAHDGPVILVRPETSPSDIHGMALATGLLTTRGGLVSHAAIVARDMGTPAVVGAEEIELDLEQRCLRVGGHVLSEEDLLTVDGASGAVLAGEVPDAAAERSEHLETLLSWANAVVGVEVAPDSPAEERLRSAHAALEGTGTAFTGRAVGSS